MTEPTGYARAPGRVNLIGDHTDYAGGFVLPMAIDLGCTVTVSPTTGASVRARSREIAGEVVCRADGRSEPRGVDPRWGAFVAGVVQAVTARGGRVPAVELDVTSSVPAGSGLSSSSALSVALVLAVADTAGLALDPVEVARAALDAEVRATDVPGGLMDQLSAVYGVAGHALLIDCLDFSVQPIALPSELVVLVAHCGIARALATSAYAERRAAVEATAARLRLRTLRDARPEHVADDAPGRHVVSENARVLAFADALRVGDLDALGPLMLASHASLRDDFEVSIPELDALVAAFVDAGALGARLTGAGFGGCVVALARAPVSEDVVRATAAGYRARTGRNTVPVAVRAAAGATSSRGAVPSSGRTPPG